MAARNRLIQKCLIQKVFGTALIARYDRRNSCSAFRIESALRLPMRHAM
jgi:hypothetical protein